MSRKPVIGVSTDTFVFDGHVFHGSGQKYLLPLIAMGAIPRLIPSFGGGADAGELLQDLDGLLLTGAVSNIEPRHYEGGPDTDCPPYDPARDSTTLPLIRATLDRGIPLLAICRGHQELNVALGGSLFARVHEQAGRLDHRAPKGEPHAVQYAPRHPVTLTPGGILAGLAGDKDVIMVNSLHWQAIDRLGQGLAVEAAAPDGTIEAVRVEGAKSFAIGVQWHPEWQHAEDEFSAALFAAFAKAVRRTG
jgi:putative glutamine amidotransferase